MSKSWNHVVYREEIMDYLHYFLIGLVGGLGFWIANWFVDAIRKLLTKP